ncbi:MAG: tetratricopeptide repeat protein, partial [Planctomycetota bacterium]
DEQAAFPKWVECAFQDGREWLDATLEIARATPSHQFVIRMHPGLVSMGANEAALIHAQELRARCPENCRVVMPKDDLSPYTLADAADAAIVYYTTMGLEMAARGQRVVCVAAGWYAHAGFAHFVQKKQDYAAAVRDALGRGRDVELARAALRFSWQCFRVWSLPFDSVAEEPMSFGSVTYENRSELEPGCDPTLDRICDYLREGKALFESRSSEPSAEQLEAESRRLAQMEEAWRSPPADDAIDLILRAEAMFQAGRIEPACELLLRALDQDPLAARGWKDLAAILHATGNPSEAIDALENALHIDPSDREALEDLAAIRA